MLVPKIGEKNRNELEIPDLEANKDENERSNLCCTCLETIAYAGAYVCCQTVLLGLEGFHTWIQWMENNQNEGAAKVDQSVKLILYKQQDKDS